MSGPVLITGASTGIGLHLAKRIAQDIQLKVYAGVRKEADMQTIKDFRISNLTPIEIDVEKPDTISACVHLLKDEGLSALINNAGIAVASPLEFIPISEFRQQLDVNVTGVLRMTQACLPLLRESHGRIVNIGSISGKMTTPLIGAYSASKFAVEAMSDAFRRELYNSGVKVILVEPGMIQTPIWEKSKDRAFENIKNLSPHAQEIYKPMMQKLIDQLEQSLKSAAQPEAVYEVVKHALLAPRPKARYLVGRDAKIGNVVRHLPDKWLDFIFSKVGAVK